MALPAPRSAGDLQSADDLRVRHLFATGAVRLGGAKRMATSAGAFPSASTGWDEEPAPAWTLDTVRGRLVELNGDASCARLTHAAALVTAAQRDREPVVWITLGQATQGRATSVAPGQGSLRPAATAYPPDLAEHGVDLTALPTIPVAKPGDALRAADQLLRSGAFGLVVLDLDAGRYQAPLAVQVRLANLCQRHEATLLCLTEQKAFVLASLRGQGQRRRDPEGYRCTIEVGKDKKHGREWEWSEVCRGPVGMR